MHHHGFRNGLIGVGLAAALALTSASIAHAAGAPASASSMSAQPSVVAAAPTSTAPVVTSVVTIKGRTAGTGTNFSGTYAVQQGGALVPGVGKAVELQRKSPTGWETVEADTADVNGNVVYGTVHSNFVQTWRLVTAVGTTDADFGVSTELKVAQHGRAVSALRFATPGFRTRDHVAFNGSFTYRSWWITSGPDRGKEGYAAPLGARVYLQYRSGSSWKTKTSVPTEDRGDIGVNAYIEITTQTPAARVWRLYYPGSATRTSAVSGTLTR